MSMEETMVIGRDCIVSASEIVKNFSSFRKKAKEGKDLVIFKNNKPDLALMDIDEYENLKRIANLLEYYEIEKIIKERKLKDDGVRYSLWDVKAMFND